MARCGYGVFWALARPEWRMIADGRGAGNWLGSARRGNRSRRLARASGCRRGRDAAGSAVGTTMCGPRVSDAPARTTSRPAFSLRNQATMTAAQVRRHDRVPRSQGPDLERLGGRCAQGRVTGDNLARRDFRHGLWTLVTVSVFDRPLRAGRTGKAEAGLATSRVCPASPVIAHGFGLGTRGSRSYRPP
jgi:hypothetical protein